MLTMRSMLHLAKLTLQDLSHVKWVDKTNSAGDRLRGEKPTFTLCLHVS